MLYLHEHTQKKIFSKQAIINYNLKDYLFLQLNCWEPIDTILLKSCIFCRNSVEYSTAC